MQLEVAFPVTGNNLPYMAPIYAVTYGGGNMLSEDSCFGQPCTHIIYNYNPNGTYYDTLTTCVSYVSADSVGNIDTLWCCFDQYWNGHQVPVLLHTHSDDQGRWQAPMPWN